MASAILGGLFRQGWQANKLSVVEKKAEARQLLHSGFAGVTVHANIDEVAPDLTATTLIVLAVKPQQMQTSCEELAGLLNEQTIVTIAAGIPLATLSQWLGGYRRLIRAMPNTPSLIGSGVTGLYAWPEVIAAGRKAATELMQAVGHCLWVEDEALMDAITAVSGSGPAYAFLLIEIMQNSAEQLGIDPAEARQMAAITVSGAAQLVMKTDEPVQILRQRVTSKGGTTEAALDKMLDCAVPDGIAAGIMAAEQRGREIAAASQQTGSIS